MRHRHFVPGRFWSALRVGLCVLTLDAAAPGLKPALSPADSQVPAVSPAAEVPAGAPSPEVTTITPPRVLPGFDIDLKVAGKNFQPGAKVSFANPGIRTFEMTFVSNSELKVHIKVALDAVPGTASLFVVNPDDNEVEAPFEVAAQNPGPASVPLGPSPTGASEVAAGAQRYAAFHLGSPAEIVHTRGKVRGALVVGDGAIVYEEGERVLINMPLSDIREIKTTTPVTFQIALISGQTFHFAAGSLHASEARYIVDALRRALANSE